MPSSATAARSHSRRLSLPSATAAAAAAPKPAAVDSEQPQPPTQRRSSPLKHQMSLTSSSELAIDPHRSHAGGPLATPYSAPPDRDPLSVSVNNSPGRSLLSAFQAAGSPSTSANAAAHRPTASLLSAGGSALGLRSAGSPSRDAYALQPASPIASPQRRAASPRVNWASEAMRAANGADVSPVATRTARSSTGSAQASPRRQSGVVYSPVKAQAETSMGWQIYQDPPRTGSVSVSTSAAAAEPSAPASPADEGEDDWQAELENDENEAIADENISPSSATREALPPPLPLPTPRSRRRLSTLSTVLGTGERDRERTPPMLMAGNSSIADVFGTPQAARARAEAEGYEPDAEATAGEEERRKRRRISDVE